MTLKICIAQLNFVVGDLPGNAQKIIDAAMKRLREGARLVLTPELSICGYAAEDLFLRPAFIAACDDAVKRWPANCGVERPGVVVGHPTGGDCRTRAWRCSAPERGQRAARRPDRAPMPSASCPTTRCSTSAAISCRAGRLRVRGGGVRVGC
jgi:predicted amidohydrolase